MQQILLCSIGLDDHEAHYDVSLNEKNFDDADQILLQAFHFKPPDQIVGLNIGTSENGKVRRWPAEHHVMLAKELAANHPDLGIVILSGPEDEEVLAKVEIGLAHSANNIAILPNDIEIGTFIGVVGKLAVLVSSNSFALHAGLSQNVRVVTFENPLPPQELELSSQDVCLGPKLSCGPCYNRCTQTIAGRCMSEVAVNDVVESVERLLESSNVYLS